MTENEARYIVRMIDAFRNNMLFIDATTGDESEFDRIKARYDEAGRCQSGAETALAEFILRTVENGVPGGEYLQAIHFPDEYPMMDLYLAQRKIPRIERPSAGAGRKAVRFGDLPVGHAFTHPDWKKHHVEIKTKAMQLNDICKFNTVSIENGYIFRNAVSNDQIVYPFQGVFDFDEEE